MSDNRENRRQTRRISSILKNVVSSDESPTQTFSRRSKRISFSHVNNVKEFRADVDNQTIWGESYEKGHNSGSVSPTIDSIAPTSTLSSEGNAPVIELFADIDDDSAEMEISQSQSEAHTNGFDQTIVIEETVTTSTTKHVDKSVVVGNTNKRKTIETTSVDTVRTDVTKSVKKIRMNDENLEPEMYSTVLHHVNVDVSGPERTSTNQSKVDLNTTRMFEEDADMSDVSLQQFKLPDNSEHFYKVGPSKMLDKTCVNTEDISFDRSSVTSFVSDTSIPIGQKTQIFGRGDISAEMDQTFAVRNPLQENNDSVRNAADKLDDSAKQTADYEMMANVPVAQSDTGNNRHQTLEDLTIQMDIQFKSHLLSPRSLNPDEPAIEDLTILLDTNFQAEVSGENDNSAIQSMSKPANSKSSGGFSLENNLLGTEQMKSRGHPEPLNVLPRAENKENVFANDAAEHRQPNVTDQISKDLSLDGMDYVACRDNTLNPTLHAPVLYDSTNDKLQRARCLDYSAAHDPVASTDFSFACADPLSSTRFVPNSKFPLNFSHIDSNNKVNCSSSSVTFNDCPTPITKQLKDLRSATSMQNNTDELCNLEPDQLKPTSESKLSEAKKEFLGLTQMSSSDMLSETKMDLVNITDSESVNTSESKRKEFLSLTQRSSGKKLNEAELNAAKQYFIRCSQMSSSDMLSETKMELYNITNSESVNDSVKESEPNNQTMCTSSRNIATGAETTTEIQKESRCRECTNCRRKLYGDDETFAGVGINEPPKLDFSVYDQFKGLPTMRDVIAARKKREAAREAEELLLLDQNVEAPDIRTLMLNKYSENTAEPSPVYVPKPLICYPMRMNIKYLMNNKMNTEYSQWKYNDNFFQIGAIAIRYNEIPSIRIHIKFDVKAPMKAEELNMALHFNRVFIEQCSTYLNNISTTNLLKHNDAYGLLPINLLSLLSSSDNIYRGLDEIEKRFQTVIAKVNEFDAITMKHDTLVRMGSDGTCYVTKMLFDIKKMLAQQIVIEFDKIEMIGPDNVSFDPVCETTVAFKALPRGLPFLRSFLSDPMSYVVRVSDVAI